MSKEVSKLIPQVKAALPEKRNCEPEYKMGEDVVVLSEELITKDDDNPSCL